MPSTISKEVWRYQIIPYCDLLSLIRLSWTNRVLWYLLNTPEMVVEWQTQCHYLFRECKCPRNLFYLQPQLLCDFTYDVALELGSQWESDQRLTHLGRSVLQMLNATHNIQGWTEVPHLDPMYANKAQFTAGLFQSYMEDMLIPAPRMLFVGVEHSRIHPQNHTRCVGETEDAFKRRQFWRSFHEITDDRPTTNDSGFILSARIDLVDAYVHKCEEDESARDPYDPADDPDCDGHHAAQWARRCMYETPVGMQAYPLELCLRREQLMGNQVRQFGVDYIDRLFLPIRRYSRDQALLDHRGPVYFSGIRYENERGDFVNWAMSTYTLQNAIYSHLWLDSSNRFIDTLQSHVIQISREIEDDMPIQRLITRWNYLEHSTTCPRRQTGGNCGTHVHDSSLEGLKRDKEARALLRHPGYEVYNHLIQNAVRDGYQWDHPFNQEYLVALIPGGAYTYQRTETQICSDIHNLLELTSYVTEFSKTVAPRVGIETTRMREATLRIYLRAGFSLLAFAPTWRRTHSWRPSLTKYTQSLSIPVIDVTKNHRMQRYLKFLNRRTLYYHHAHEMVLHPDAWQVDLARHHHSN